MSADRLPANGVIFCPTRRLARSLALGGAATGDRLVPAYTMAAWLERVFDEALLRGQLSGAELAVRVLTPLQERLVWRQVIGRALGRDGTAALFDLDGLAAAAQDAHGLMETWGLSAAAVQAGGQDEAARFLQWRHAFLRLCDGKAWRDGARQLRWQVGKIAGGLGTMPREVGLAGFDRFNPAEQSLLDALAARGVTLREWSLAPAAAPQISLQPFADVESEYRALAGWLRERLEANPTARLGVVVPDLAAARPLLTRLLDQAIAPEAFAARAEAPPRRYNLSLGQALNGVPLVETAMALLRLAVQPRRVAQEALGALLLSPYWSSGQGEADGRALLDADARARLPAVLTLDRWLRFAGVLADRGLPAGRTVRHLGALRKAAGGLAGKRLPGDWADAFRRLLASAGWPGDRTLSSHDYQAREAFYGSLDALAGFDSVVGEQSAGEALALLTDIGAETLFQPKTEGTPPVQVLGLLEAAGERFDGLWVSGMLAAAWPPPARPNPLLPAALQRAAGTPNASPEVQLAFASGVHARFLQAAPEVIFSWPQRDGERELPPSPLLGGAPDRGPAKDVSPFTPAESAVEAARRAAAGRMEAIDDAVAPPVAELAQARHLKGGTALLKAQAVCPAAAFYQFRLGAGALESPVDGLDPRARGSLLHFVLEHFWRNRSLADVHAWPEATRRAEVERAVDAGLAEFEAGKDGRGDNALPPRFRRIERTRLCRLLATWLALELTRPVPFRVVACEERHELELDGIVATVVIDRIDELDDGRRLVLDYKTGASVDARSWSERRITEPQLPIYAAFAVNPHPLAGAAFAQVRSDRMGFVGLTDSAGVLPKVKGLAEARKRYPEADFPDWPALLARWRDALLAIAGEIRAGDARVVFADERDLALSPVLPLLRLAERRRQYEQAAGSSPEGGDVERD